MLALHARGHRFESYWEYEIPPQWCNGSTRDCDSLSSSSNLGWRTKIKKKQYKIVIVYPLFYEKVFCSCKADSINSSRLYLECIGWMGYVTPARRQAKTPPFFALVAQLDRAHGYEP